MLSVALCYQWASQVAPVIKNPPANAGNMRRGFDPWVRKIPWRKKWQPTPVFLPGDPRGQRSLVVYSPWGGKRDPHDLGTKHITHNAAAAKSLQSCPTLCDPIDGSPPGSLVPGILQARTLEWVAISFSNA